LQVITFDTIFLIVPESFTAELKLPAAALYATIKDKAATAHAKHFH
jgi:hypothetical protein